MWQARWGVGLIRLAYTMLLITALSFLVCLFLFVCLFFTVRGRSALSAVHDPHTVFIIHCQWKIGLGNGSFDKGGRVYFS